MFEAVPSPYLVPFEGGFNLSSSPTTPPDDVEAKGKLKDRLRDIVDELDDLQQRLYAHNQWGVLLVFQAMDAAGKDSTIRAVLRGVDPVGCQVFSFKAPSKRELDHDFLWRVASRVPERGRIGVFNRSHYEEVLVVRVHPEYLGGQHLPRQIPLENLWEERFQSIVDWERHIARNGYLVLKFFLNVSHAEQGRRFQARLDRPHKNWKFSEADLAERALWPRYMEAYQAALGATSRPWAPWYAIPADDKGYMRWTVADIVQRSMASVDLAYPTLDARALARIEEFRERLRNPGA